MNIRNYIFIFLLLFVSIELVYSQQLFYTYSPTGNRLRCYVGYAKISANPDEQEKYTETLDNIQFNIYPNPTKGLLKINIDMEQKVEKIVVELYDVNGKKVIDRSVTSKEIELDITKESTGNYFMKVFVNGRPYYWNILKE